MGFISFLGMRDQANFSHSPYLKSRSFTKEQILIPYSKIPLTCNWKLLTQLFYKQLIDEQEFQKCIINDGSW